MFVICHSSVQLSCLYLQQPPKYQSWRRTKRITGHSDRDSSRHIPCSVHGLSSAHQQTWNWHHGYASASVPSSIGVLWQTVFESFVSQHHWLAQIPLILWEHFQRLCLCADWWYQPFCWLYPANNSIATWGTFSVVAISLSSGIWTSLVKISLTEFGNPH